MTKVMFFARLREQLGVNETVIDLPSETSLCHVVELLVAQHGESWEVLKDDDILCSVNQSIATREKSVIDGDEIAFFPPMTGG